MAASTPRRRPRFSAACCPRASRDATWLVSSARRPLRGLARDAPGAARHAREQLTDTGWDAPILGSIVELIDQRAQWLLDLTAGRA